jgi:short-subunit dehydrogenase involved in D-alanine esterification of teichoic acids
MGTALITGGTSGIGGTAMASNSVAGPTLLGASLQR